MWLLPLVSAFASKSELLSISSSYPACTVICSSYFSLPTQCQHFRILYFSLLTFYPVKDVGIFNPVFFYFAVCRELHSADYGPSTTTLLKFWHFIYLKTYLLQNSSSRYFPPRKIYLSFYNS